MTWTDWTGNAITRAPDRLNTSVSAVIQDGQGRVLLMHRSDNGFWGLPGGNMEIGESVIQATRREVREETGLEIEVGRLVGVYSDPAIHMIATYPNGVMVHYVNLCFAGIRTSGELQGSDEGMEVGYFATDALPEKVILSHRLRIQDALANQAEPFIR